MSKRIRERDAAFELFDSEFETALQDTEYRQRDRGRRIQQKTQQLCRQVQRALNLALAGRFTADALEGVFVTEVSAAAGCGRLVAHVTVPAGHCVNAALQELCGRSPQLRAVVAGYISRKRVPEVSFVHAPTEGAADE